MDIIFEEGRNMDRYEDPCIIFKNAFQYPKILWPTVRGHFDLRAQQTFNFDFGESYHYPLHYNINLPQACP